MGCSHGRGSCWLLIAMPHVPACFAPHSSASGTCPIAVEAELWQHPLQVTLKGQHFSAAIAGQAVDKEVTTFSDAFFDDWEAIWDAKLSA